MEAHVAHHVAHHLDQNRGIKMDAHMAQHSANYLDQHLNMMYEGVSKSMSIWLTVRPNNCSQMLRFVCERNQNLTIHSSGVTELIPIWTPSGPPFGSQSCDSCARGIDI